MLRNQKAYAYLVEVYSDYVTGLGYRVHIEKNFSRDDLYPSMIVVHRVVAESKDKAVAKLLECLAFPSSHVFTVKLNYMGGP